MFSIFKIKTNTLLNQIETNSNVFVLIVILFFSSTSLMVTKFISDLLFVPVVFVNSQYTKQVHLDGNFVLKAELNRSKQMGCTEVVDRYFIKNNEPTNYIPISSSVRTVNTEKLIVNLSIPINSTIFSEGIYQYRVKYYYNCNIIDHIFGPKIYEPINGLEFKVLPKKVLDN